MHGCAVGVCDAPCPDKNLMCRAHWFMVPPALRLEVWRAYNQSIDKPHDRQRLDALREVQKRAVCAVEARLAAEG